MQKPIKDIILVIEKDPDNTKLFSLIFRNQEFQVLYSQKIKDAKKLIDRFEIKLIISDIINTDGDIVDFYEKVEHSYPHIKRMLLTDYIDNEKLSDAINRGRIFNYLPKPIDPKKLIVVIKNALDQYNLSKRNEGLVTDLKAKNIELVNLLQELKNEEEKFRNIFNSSPDPSFIIQKDGSILLANHSAQQFCCKKNKECKYSSIFELVYSDSPINLKNYILDVNSNTNSTLEVFIDLGDRNRIKYYELKGYTLNYKGEECIRITLRDISVKKEMEQKVIQTIIQTEEKERRRFAQELHDGIGPLLSTTKLYLQWFNKPESKMDKGIIISKMEETLEETVASIREISNNLSPNTLNSFGLGAALKTFINRIRNVSDINFIYNNKLTKRLDEHIEITIYRLICELINNSIKHSEAKRVNIQIEDNKDIEILYYDDGKGFDVVEKLKSGKGAGLMNLSTRVQSLGGLYNIDSKPGKGTKVHIKLSAN